MPKKMTSPQKTPPADGAVGTVVVNGTPPSIQVSEARKETVDSTAAPTLMPPASAGQNEGIGAAVWNTDKRVNGLYTTHHARNSWMSIAGVGWVRLATSHDSACEAMTILASTARAKNFRIDYAVDASLTTEMYIW